jgi:hypothetical protein
MVLALTRERPRAEQFGIRGGMSHTQPQAA